MSGKITEAKGNAGLAELREKVGIARQPVQLGDHKGSLVQTRQRYRLCQFRARALTAGLNLNEFFDQPPVTAIQKCGDDLALRLQTEPGTALLIGRNPQIAYEISGICHGS